MFVSVSAAVGCWRADHRRMEESSCQIAFCSGERTCGLPFRPQTRMRRHRAEPLCFARACFQPGEDTVHLPSVIVNRCSFTVIDDIGRLRHSSGLLVFLTVPCPLSAERRVFRLRPCVWRCFDSVSQSFGTTLRLVEERVPRGSRVLVPVAQWIEPTFPKRVMRVRFSPGTLRAGIED